MPSQSTHALQTSRSAPVAEVSRRPGGGGRGNAAAAERVEGAATSREPGGFTATDGAVQHAVPQAGSAVNAGGKDTPARIPGPREVRIRRTEDDPLMVAGSSPAEEDLYEERPLGEDCAADWQAVEGICGSVACPSRTENLVEGSLFVGGGPSVADVHQGKIGDCYLLASLIGLVAADPGRIADMVQVSGGSAVVSFFRKDDATGQAVPTAITVNLDLAHRTDAQGWQSLQGAGFRRSEEPVVSEWYAQPVFDDLWVCQDAYYEAAMWVPLIEKAYARFAERYGQYGGFEPHLANAPVDGQGNARSGYEIIEGGRAELLLRVLLGSDEREAKSVDVEWSPGAANVQENKEVILGLLRQRGDGWVPGKRSVTTVAMDEEMSIQRLGRQAALLLEGEDIGEYPDFERAVRRLHLAVESWAQAPDGPGRDAPKSAVVAAARRMVAPGTWPILGSGRADGGYRALNELLLIVANLGDDAGPGRRHVYAKHEYVVVGSTFRDAQGSEIALNAANLATALSAVDARSSEVQLRNPHGSNSPDPAGTRTEDDGAFTLTLDQYLRSFSAQTSTVLN